MKYFGVFVNFIVIKGLLSIHFFFFSFVFVLVATFILHKTGKGINGKFVYELFKQKKKRKKEKKLECFIWIFEQVGTKCSYLKLNKQNLEY